MSKDCLPDQENLGEIVRSTRIWLQLNFNRFGVSFVLTPKSSDLPENKRKPVPYCLNQLRRPSN